MPVPREVEDWIARSEVDHVGPFVNAWAAFNAWYRHVARAFDKERDRLNYIRTQPNTVRGAIMPLVDPDGAETPDSLQFRAMLAELHGALEAFRLETVNDLGITEHVSFRSVPLNRRVQLPQRDGYRGVSYRVDKPHGVWTSTVTDKAGVEVARIEQPEYDAAALERDNGFVRLSDERQRRLRVLYADCNPRPMVNLLVGNEPEIVAGTIAFRCTCEDLFGGIIETIYRMRNMLLHGELSPDPAALACYAPAYHMLRRMLRECR